MNAHEFSPRNVYSLAIFDSNWPSKDAPCYAEGSVGCQIAGSLNFDLPGANTVPPHAHMGDHCGFDYKKGC